MLACSAAPPPAAPPAPPARRPVVAVALAAPAPAALPAGVPDSTAGHQLVWVLAAIAKAPSEADAATHFTPDFLAKVPAATVVGLFGQISTGAPFTLESVSAATNGLPTELVAVVRATDGSKIRIWLSVDPATGQMGGLLLRPKVDAKTAASWGEVLADLQAVGPKVSFLAAEVDGGKCLPISSLEPKRPLALGSTFKLYVLDALARQVATGKHAWDEQVVIRDALKSLPSGAMRDEPPGKAFSVEHFAEQMISVSDNTATDHLLDLVGRSAVEDAVTGTGHQTPSVMQPFLKTRELFALKLLASQEERATYVSLDLPHRRKLLDKYGAKDLAPAMAAASGFTKPIMVDKLEWFASPEDLCRVMVDLHTRAQTLALAPIASILSLNPGFPDENHQYAYIAFKGGSEPGVLNLTFLMQRARDSKWLFMTAGWNDTAAPIDETKAFAAVVSAREFLGR